MPVDAVFLSLLAITAVAIVLLQTFVGIVMVIAMLTLPAGCASVFSRSLAGMMFLAGLCSAFFALCGLAAAWAFDLPVGAVTVVIAGLVFLGISALRMRR